jgi:hypothetical protein
MEIGLKTDYHALLSKLLSTPLDPTSLRVWKAVNTNLLIPGQSAPENAAPLAVCIPGQGISYQCALGFVSVGPQHATDQGVLIEDSNCDRR